MLCSRHAFKKGKCMINRYGFLLAILCILRVLQAMEKEESQIDWEDGSNKSFLGNIKDFHCPDDTKTDESATVPNPDNVKIQIPLQQLRKVKERQSTPRPKKLNDIIKPEEKSIFHDLLAEAIAVNTKK